MVVEIKMNRNDRGVKKFESGMKRRTRATKSFILSLIQGLFQHMARKVSRFALSRIRFCCRFDWTKVLILGTHTQRGNLQVEREMAVARWIWSILKHFILVGECTWWSEWCVNQRNLLYKVIVDFTTTWLCPCFQAKGFNEKASQSLLCKQACR